MPEDTTIDSGTTQANADTVPATTAPEADETTPVTEPAAAGLPGGDETPAEGEEESSDADGTGDELKGAPEEYAELDLSAGEDIGYALTDEQKDSFTAFGKEHNLDDKQMQGIVAFDIAREKETAATNATFISDYKTEGIKASRKEHGEKYTPMHTKNTAAYEKFFNEEGRKALNDMGISSQPYFFNALNKMSAELSEDTTVRGDGGGNSIKNRTLAQAASNTT